VSNKSKKLKILQIIEIGRRRVVSQLSRSLYVREVNDHRATNCTQENDCLALAGAQDWLGFSCTSCPRFREQKQSLAVMSIE